ncbi:MAG: UTP--glucose-1-phosphate uridylyltransferase [Candidatus Babeliales bacterium]
MEIIKAIIPAAGLGTRFMPCTKTIPKEMLPLLNKPALHYIVDEGMQSGIDNFFVITNKRSHDMANYFDHNFELDLFLKDKAKLSALADIERIATIANFTYIRQAEPRGLGHAIWRARHSINKEYFGVCLPDDIIVSKIPALDQLMRIARQEKASVIAVAEVPTDKSHHYGMVGIKKQFTPQLFQVSHLVEKPAEKDTPSNLAIVGRYILSHKLFPALEEIETDFSGELQLTDGIANMMRNGEKVFAYKVQGTRYDIGTPAGWLKANISFALQDPRYSAEIRAYFKELEQLEQFMVKPAKIMERVL